MMRTPEFTVYNEGDEQPGDGNAVPIPARIVQRNGHAVSTSEPSPATQRGKERFVDPSLSDAILLSAEREFIQAMDAYKKRNGRMFSTWSEVLEVLVTLGYKKVGPTGLDSA
jgi:hypothetical protein